MQQRYEWTWSSEQENILMEGVAIDYIFAYLCGAENVIDEIMRI